MRAVASFLDMNIEEALWPQLVHNATFDTVKKNPDKVVSDQAKTIFKDGAHSFINKGTNGRWKGVLSDDELAQYETVKAQAVTADCAKWLETGGPIDAE